MASHEAARVAVNAGYKDVSVMTDGVIGWSNAGMDIAHVSDSQGGEFAH